MKQKLSLVIVGLLFALYALLAFAVQWADAQQTACYGAQGGTVQTAASGCEYEFRAGSVLDVQSGATVVWDGSQFLKHNVTGRTQFCATNTITDTASYTATVTAISTPVYTWCSMNAITGDANNCAAIHGVGNITVTVRNAAATPAANATGAAVTWCVLGTPQ